MVEIQLFAKNFILIFRHFKKKIISIPKDSEFKGKQALTYKKCCVILHCLLSSTCFHVAGKYSVDSVIIVPYSGLPILVYFIKDSFIYDLKGTRILKNNIFTSLFNKKLRCIVFKPWNITILIRKPHFQVSALLLNILMHSLSRWFLAIV